MGWSPKHTQIRNVFAGLYLSSSDAQVVARDIGLPIQYIAWDSKPITLWQSIIQCTINSGKITQLIDRGLQDFPQNIILRGLKDDTIYYLDEQPEDIVWKSDTHVNNLEKIVGKDSTLRPISFLELGLSRSKSVCRIVLSNDSCGTGFLIDNNVIMTNHHVIPDESSASSAEVQFNVQKTIHGGHATPVIFKLDPMSGFRSSAVDDWSVIRIKGDATSEFGSLKLSSTSPHVGDRVNIIQHPQGLDKQIAMYHNTVVFVDNPPTRIQYLTDTMRGSSGSPVFNELWEVVALHHAGASIPVFGTKQFIYRNQGISSILLRNAIFGF